MKVKLIALTQPVVRHETEDRCLTAEELIAYAARVSNPSNQHSHDTAPRLLTYCLKHGHWSVFETASMTVEVVTSRAIAAQMLRHRSFTFQEFSQRYAMSVDYELVELRTQDAKNRQASGEPIHNTELHRLTHDVVNQCFDAYQDLLKHGVSRETARMVLPLCTQTTLYMTGNVRSWLHYFNQRCALGTQKEHREIALAIKAIFSQQFPTISSLL